MVGMSRLDYIIGKNRVVNSNDAQKIGEILNRLATQEPIQYILGYTEFYGLPFKVSPDVLVPRQETEELVDLIIKTQLKAANQDLSILDIGTGSGCIAVALSKFMPNSKVYALDVSKPAIEMAEYNAALNDVDVTFLTYDVLSSKAPHFSEADRTFNDFDIIVSNPPYVRELEVSEMKLNVLNYEPKLALFVPDDDALVFYKAIAELAKQYLKKGGWLFFEINQYLGSEMRALLKNYGFKNIDLLNDINGNQRMLKAQFL